MRRRSTTNLLQAEEDQTKLNQMKMDIMKQQYDQSNEFTVIVK